MSKLKKIWNELMSEYFQEAFAKRYYKSDKSVLDDEEETQMFLLDKINKKYNNKEKPSLSIFPPRALEAITRVAMYGDKKHGKANYLETTSLYSYWLDKILRHVMATIKGEDKDPETGELHLAHAGCDLVMLIEALELGKVEDDRRFKNENK